MGDNRIGMLQTLGLDIARAYRAFVGAEFSYHPDFEVCPLYGGKRREDVTPGEVAAQLRKELGAEPCR